MRNALVTGGGGFIGSNLVRTLVERGYAVKVLDDWSTGSPANLAGLEGSVQVIEADVRDSSAVSKATAGTEVLYHLAALPSVARSIADPHASHSVNASGTLTILTAARDSGVQRVVYASSSSIYGDTPTLPKHEEMPVNPRSPYAAAKLSGEAYSRAFTQAFGLETVSLRFFNVFGPRQDPASEYAAVIPRFITRMASARPPKIYGVGTQSRDFTFVSNAVDACVRAGEADSRSAGEVINVGCGSRVTLLEIVGALNSLMGTRLEPELGPPREGDVMHSQADISRAITLLGYQPSVTVTEGLSRTVEWFTHSPPTGVAIGKGAA